MMNSSLILIESLSDIVPLLMSVLSAKKYTYESRKKK